MLRWGLFAEVNYIACYYISSQALHGGLLCHHKNWDHRMCRQGDRSELHRARTGCSQSKRNSTGRGYPLFGVAIRHSVSTDRNNGHTRSFQENERGSGNNWLVRPFFKLKWKSHLNAERCDSSQSAYRFQIECSSFQIHCPLVTALSKVFRSDLECRFLKRY